MTLVNRRVNCELLNAVPIVGLHNWKEWVMQQTKYCSNVIMMSVSGRKKNKINKNLWNRMLPDMNHSHVILANVHNAV